VNFIPIASSSSGNCYLITSGKDSLLLDAGIPIKRIREELWKRGLSLSDLSGCCIDHEHMDHSRAVKDLLKSGVDIYASSGTIDALQIGWHHRANTPEKGLFFIGPWAVVSVPLEHDAAEPTGFFIACKNDSDKMLFIPDTGYIKNRFLGVNILAIECNHLESTLSENILNGSIPAVAGRRTRRSHMSLSRVIDMLKANDLSKCREVWLIHLSDANSSESIMIRKIQEELGVPVYVAQR